MKRYAEFFGRHRPIVAAFVVIMTTLAAFGLRGLEFDDVARGIFESDDEEHARLAAFYDEFGSDDNDALVVLEADDWFEPQNANLLRGAVEAIRGLEGIESVFGLPDVPVFDAGLLPRSLVPAAGADPAVFAMARERALEHPLVAGRLLSADGRTTLIVARLAGGALGIEDIEPVVDELNAIAAELGGRAEIRARVTGIPPIRVEIYGTIRSEQVLFTGLGGVLSLIIAWLLFRSPGAVLSACVPPGLGAASLFWLPTVRLEKL